jgi:hypothetical protein
MSKMKYIVVDMNIPEPFVFSETVTHADVARAVGGTVLGAGFCQIAGDQFHCYGESISLRVKSRGDEDSNILNKRFGLGEFY